MYPAGQQFSRSGQQTAFGRGQHEYSQGLIHGQHVSNILHITPSGHTLHVVRFNDGVSCNINERVDHFTDRLDHLTYPRQSTHFMNS